MSLGLPEILTVADVAFWDGNCRPRNRLLHAPSLALKDGAEVDREAVLAEVQGLVSSAMAETKGANPRAVLCPWELGHGYGGRFPKP